MRKNVVAGALLALVAAVPLSARDLKPIDDFAAAKPHGDATAFVSERARGLARAGAAIPVEARLRVPTFVWAARDESSPSQQPGPAAGPKEGREERAARAHLGRFRDLYSLNASDVSGATLHSVHTTRRGPVIVKFRQQVAGIEIFREEMSVILDRELELIGISGYLTSGSAPGAHGKPLSFVLGERDGVLSAIRDLVDANAAAKDLVAGQTNGAYATFTLPGAALETPVRVKRVYFHQQDGLEPGYYVEVIARDFVTNELDAYAYVISARDGRILFRNSLMSNAGTAYSYRVWAGTDGHPWDSPVGNGAIPKPNPVLDGYQPPILAQTDVTVANYPFSKNDPWLPDGATETVGNNVDAYVDLFYPDGYAPVAAPATPATGDFRAQTTGANAFLHTYDAAQPQNHVSRQAAATQLFVDINFLHDWFYDAGFDEAAGNAQNDNYGRGGVAGDRMRAEAQDSSGTNNANMLTPADGGSPRMQMYLYEGAADTPRFEVLDPAGIAGRKSFAVAFYIGPQSYDVSQTVVEPLPLNACSALTNASSVAGKIVLVDREPTSGEGACSIPTKLANIAAAGAAGVALVNLSSWPDTVYNFSESITGYPAPVISIAYDTAAAIRAQIAAGNPVTAQMMRPTYGPIYRDGTIDNGIVAHEWGHYLSNRLIGNGSGLSATQARGMGEGWSDFLALLLAVRPDDVATPSNATWNGVYASGGFARGGGTSGGANQSFYFGPRRAPYSTDMAKNALTYKHTQHGAELPTSAMVIRPNTLSNAQYHNTGEIWALMLWECYASLLRDTQGATPRLTFAEAQARMKEYLVAGLKMTPVNPTILEARDALLAAAIANDREDYLDFIQAFAKRGAGIGAVAADRYSTTNAPVIESFIAGGDARIVSWALAEDDGTCDADGILDNGESGQVTITIKNTGSTELAGITGTVSTSTAGLTFPSGAAVTFPDIDLGETASVTVPVALAAGGSTGIRTLALSIEYSHASMDVVTQAASAFLRANFDVMQGASATETVEEGATPWTVVSGVANGDSPWTRLFQYPKTVWKAVNSGRVSDERLESPPMKVSTAGTLRVEFDHTYSFESYYDGGVVEMSRNDGPWLDIGGNAYNGYVYYGTNPLSGRSCFTGASAGALHVTLRPTVVAGDVVRVRFRVATDSFGSAPGWEIDNITFSGVEETPFSSTVADSGCTKMTTTRLTSNANPSREGTSLTLRAGVAAPGLPTGTVTFLDGASVVGTAPLVDRVALLSTASLAAGLHSLTARYEGTTGFASSTSAPLVQGVDSCTGNPTIAFLSPAASIPAGGLVQLTVTAGGGSVFSYAWYEGYPGDLFKPVGTQQTIEVTPSSNTRYWVRVTNGCGHVDSSAVEVNLVPPAMLYTMTPCRAWDSRLHGAPLSPNSSRYLELAWYPSNCIPTGARAVALNVTVVSPGQDGYLTLYSSDSPRPNTSTTSFRAGKTRANNAIVSLGSTYWGSIYVYNGSSAPVQYVIDVFAYFK